MDGCQLWVWMGRIWVCGDGVLGSSAGEECDVIGASWCVSCKITLNTNPGANPITSLKIRIPGLSNVGSAHFGIIPINEHRVVVGKGTSVFTLKDEVILDVTTQYQIPIMLPADRLLCLSSTGSAIEDNTLCNPVSRYAPVRTINGSQYVVIGGGYYQNRRSDNTYENIRISSPTNSVTLFNGYDLSRLTNKP